MGEPVEKLAGDELKPGESIFWSGWPVTRRGNRWNEGGPVMAVFAGALIGIAVGVVIIRLFGINSPIVLMLTMPLGAVFFGRGSSSRHRKRMAIYALTDRRVFSCSKLYRTVHVRTLPLNQLASVVVDYRDHDRHTVLFHSSFPDGGDAERPYLRFRLVSNKKWMLALLRDLRPDVTIMAMTPPVEKERKTTRLRDRLPGRRA